IIVDISRHYFFFQAEDGIRDRNVTGVQTCALPIYKPLIKRPSIWNKVFSERLTKNLFLNFMGGNKGFSVLVTNTITDYQTLFNRSEERRVGKEWTSWCIVE